MKQNIQRVTKKNVVISSIVSTTEISPKVNMVPKKTFCAWSIEILYIFHPLPPVLLRYN